MCTGVCELAVTLIMYYAVLLAIRGVAQLLTHPHIGGLLTVCWWLGNMASHKYFNHTWLINMKLSEEKIGMAMD